MPPTVDDGGELHAWIAAAHVQSADSLRPINLVRADGQQVDVVPLDVDRNLAHCLHAVHRKENPAFLGNLADFRDGVDHANFVIGVHDGDQNRRRLDGRFQILQADPSVALYREISHLKTVLFQILAGVEHGDRKSTRLNSSHGYISYAVFCLKKKKTPTAARGRVARPTRGYPDAPRRPPPAAGRRVISHRDRHTSCAHYTWRNAVQLLRALRA